MLTLSIFPGQGAEALGTIRLGPILHGADLLGTWLFPRGPQGPPSWSEQQIENKHIQNMSIDLGVVNILGVGPKWV